MAQRQCTPLRRSLSRMLPAPELRRLARSTGALCRKRKVDPVELFWSLVLGLDGPRLRRIANLRRSFEKASGVRLSASSFYNRFTPALTRFLRLVMMKLLEKVVEPSEGAVRGLDKIKEILCVDSSVIRLHDALARTFPACRTNHTLSAAKLHMVLNVRGRGPKSIKITSERVHDGPVLRAGRWVRGRLLIFDLGYYRYQLFDAIGRSKGFFLTRLKDNANPVIVKLHRIHRGRAIPAEGRGLQEIKADLRREVFDAEAEVHFRRRAYGGLRSGACLTVRVVGLRDDKHGGYHWYITNLPPETAPAEEIGKLYSSRWSIELLFREMKSCYHLESMPSWKAHVVEAFLYLAVITVLVSRTVLGAVRRWARLEDRRIPMERWARLFVSAAPTLLAIVLDPARQAKIRERHLLPFLVTEAPDPNVSRLSLIERAGLSCLA